MNKTEHLLTILAEECAEVAQRASKAIRFGLTEIQPGQPEDNKRRLERELAELIEVSELLGLVVREEDQFAKLQKVKRFMDYSRQLGTLSQDPPPKTDDRQHLLERCYLELYSSLEDRESLEYKREDNLKAAKAIARRIAEMDDAAAKPKCPYNHTDHTVTAFLPPQNCPNCAVPAHKHVWDPPDGMPTSVPQVCKECSTIRR